MRALPEDMAGTMYEPVCVQPVPVLALPYEYLDALEKPQCQALLAEMLSIKLGTPEVQRTLTQWFMLRTKEEQEVLAASTATTATTTTTTTTTTSNSIAYTTTTSNTINSSGDTLAIDDASLSLRFFESSGCPIVTERKTYYDKVTRMPVYLDTLAIRKRLLENDIAISRPEWVQPPSAVSRNKDSGGHTAQDDARSARRQLSEVRNEIKECMTWHEDIYPREWWEPLLGCVLGSLSIPCVSQRAKARARATGGPRDNPCPEEVALVSEKALGLTRLFDVFFTRPMHQAAFQRQGKKSSSRTGTGTTRPPRENAIRDIDPDAIVNERPPQTRSLYPLSMSDMVSPFVFDIQLFGGL